MIQNEIQGKTVIASKPDDGSMAEIKAKIAEVEAKGIEALFNESLAQNNNAPKIYVQSQANVPPKPEQPPVEEIKQETLRKFQNKDGSLSLDKVEKSNEHLMREIESREEKLLRLNRELQKKFTATSQELSAKKQEADEFEFTEEGNKKIISDLGLDPESPESKKLIDTFVKIARTVTRRETEPFVKDVRNLNEISKESRFLKELDDLAKEGNEWIITEGTAKIEKVLEERPYLKQSKTPYRDALKFIEPSRTGDSTAQAQAGTRTPILGASQAIQPPSSSPTSTPERELQSLNDELVKALKDHNRNKIREIEAQMERVYKGMFL